MVFERFTEQARHVVTVAQDEARMMRHGHVGTEHLLVALGDEPEIAALGLSRERARGEVVRTVGLGEVDREASPRIPFTGAAQDALAEALGEAMRLGHDTVQPGHVLLAVLKQRDGVARRVLVGAGAVPSEFREALIRRLSSPPEAGPGSLTVRVGEDLIGDLGNFRTDARLALAILERNGPMAAWLRERGVDEDALRRML